MKSLILSIIVTLLGNYTFCQVGINTDNTPPHPSAQLDVKNPNKGLLLPRVTSPASAIAGPAAGLMVYDQANANLAYYNGAQWSNLTGTAGNQGLYSRFPHSKGFHAYFKTTTISTEDFDFVVPAGITKVWVEAWGGGDSGLSTYSVSYSQPYGGAGGDFASFLIDVVPGQTMLIKVSKGGHNDIAASTQIYPNKLNSMNLVDVSRGSLNQFKYYGTISPELIAYYGGEYTQYSAPSFQNFNSNTGAYIVVYSNAEGGGSYPNYIRAKSNTFVYNNIGGYINSFGNNYLGNVPGGGAPASGDSYGGPGQVIIHW